MADKDMNGIARGLVAIDEVIRKASAGKGEPGPIGSGLYYLLDALAVTTLGIPRSTFPVEPPPEPEPEGERYDPRKPLTPVTPPPDAPMPSGGPVPADDHA
jgi:hypothetical protein